MKIIGVTGGSGSGKTYFSKKLIESKRDQASIISLDCYYNDNSHLPLNERLKINFDHPSAIDYQLLIKHIGLLIRGSSIQVPIYSFSECIRTENKTTLIPPKVLIIEGTLLYNNLVLKALIDQLIFLDIDYKKRLERVIARDINDRNRDCAETIERFEKIVEPMYNEYILPFKNEADQVISTVTPDYNKVIKKIGYL